MEDNFNTEENIDLTEAVAENSEAAENNTEEEATPTEECIIIDEPKKKFTDYLNYRILAIIGVLILLILGIFLYMFNVPAKRFQRALKKADTLYYEGKYEKASGYYDKASDIFADSVYGYLGLARTEDALDADSKESYLEKAETILSFNLVKEGEVNACLEFFLMAPDIIDDAFELRDLLLRAYAFLDEPKDLRAAIADASAGCVALMEADEKALAEVDRVLEFSGNATTYSDILKPAIIGYIDKCISTDKYTEAYTALDKYEPVIEEEAAEVTERLNTANALYETKVRVMTGAGNILGAYYDQYKESFSQENIEATDSPVFRVMEFDFFEMLLIDGSNDADILARAAMPGECLYADNGFTEGYTGVGIGLYTYGDSYIDDNGNENTAYYFYYGDYKNGKRNGYGLSIIKTDSTSYMAFEGYWENDAPNGFGVLYKNDMYSYTSLVKYRQVTYGCWNNGNADGNMVSKAVFNEHPDTYFTGSFEVANGDLCPLPGELIEYGIIDTVSDGMELIACLNSVTDGYDYFLPIYAEIDKKYSVFGF